MIRSLELDFCGLSVPLEGNIPALLVAFSERGVPGLDIPCLLEYMQSVGRSR